jgi:hypothetical protein
MHRNISLYYYETLYSHLVLLPVIPHRAIDRGRHSEIGHHHFIFDVFCFRMSMMGPMGNMGGPPQMNMGMNPGNNQPQQNKPLFPSTATVCTCSFDMILIEPSPHYYEY